MALGTYRRTVSSLVFIIIRYTVYGRIVLYVGRNSELYAQVRDDAEVRRESLLLHFCS